MRGGDGRRWRWRARRAEGSFLLCWGAGVSGTRDNSAEKERKLLPNRVEQEEGLSARKSLPREKEKEEGRAFDFAVLLVVACLKERECIVFQPVSQSFTRTMKGNNFHASR